MKRAYDFNRCVRHIECGLEDLKNGDIIIWRDTAGDIAHTLERWLRRYGNIPQGTWLIYDISKLLMDYDTGLTRIVSFINTEGQRESAHLSENMYEHAVQDVLRGEKQ